MDLATAVFPILLHYRSFILPTYGFLVVLGMGVGVCVGMHYARRDGIEREKVWNFVGLGVLSGIVVPKLLFVIDNWYFYSSHPRAILDLQAGGIWSVSLVIAVLVCLWYMLRSGMPVLKTADVAAPGIAVGHGVGRLACFAAGCCWGKPTTLPWGVTFRNPLAAQLGGAPLGIALHPTQLYEVALELANFLLLVWLLGRKHFDGQVAGTYLFVYGFGRYFLEFLRNDPGRGSVFHGIMSGTQLLAILMVVSGGLLLRTRRAAT